MRCARCGAYFDPGDNYCRHCGEPLNHHGLPVLISRSFLPVPWSVARGQVMRGAAALIVGAVVELVRREVARRSNHADPSEALALTSDINPFDIKKRGRLPWSRVSKGEYQVTETVIQRRVWFKR